MIIERSTSRLLWFNTLLRFLILSVLEIRLRPAWPRLFKICRILLIGEIIMQWVCVKKTNDSTYIF